MSKDAQKLGEGYCQVRSLFNSPINLFKFDTDDNRSMDFNQNLPFSTFWSQKSGLPQFWQEVLAGRE